MNILFYQHQYPAFGGIETVTTILARRFALDGHRIEIVSFIEKPGTNLLGQLPAGVRWEKLPSEQIDARENREKLHEIIRTFKPDRIIFQDSYASIEEVLFDVVKKSVPIVIVEHSTPQVFGGLFLSFETLNETVRSVSRIVRMPFRLAANICRQRYRRRRLYDAGARYVFLTSRYIPISNRIAGVKRCEKLLSIPNPVKESAPIPDLAHKKHEVVFCGSLILTKGVSRLIEIWGIVEKDCPDWTFRIVGDGSLRQKLEAQAKQLNLQHVVFEGFQAEVEKHYQNASIMVMASAFEGWPMVLGEAMQQGCVPVVYDSFLACYDLIDDGKNGMVIPHFKRNEFVAALRSLMRDASRLKQMQQAAIEKAQCFSLDVISKRWYELLSEVK